MHIGNKIKELAGNKKLSAQKMGNAIGLTKQAVYGIFQKEDINTNLLKQIADVLGEPISVFFDDPKVCTRTNSQGNDNNNQQGNNNTYYNNGDSAEMLAKFENVQIELATFKERCRGKDELISTLKQHIAELEKMNDFLMKGK